MLALTPFHETLLAALVPGLLIGGFFAAWGGRSARLTHALLRLVLGVGVLWFAMLAGVAYGFDAWQRLPDPPEEAFADGGPKVGALLLGWVPASLFCGVVFLVARLSARAAKVAGVDAARVARGGGD